MCGDRQVRWELDIYHFSNMWNDFFGCKMVIVLEESMNTVLKVWTFIQYHSFLQGSALSPIDTNWVSVSINDEYDLKAGKKDAKLPLCKADTIIGPTKARFASSYQPSPEWGGLLFLLDGVNGRPALLVLRNCQFMEYSFVVWSSYGTSHPVSWLWSGSMAILRPIIPYAKVFMKIIFNVQRI